MLALGRHHACAFKMNVIGRRIDDAVDLRIVQNILQAVDSLAAELGSECIPFVGRTREAFDQFQIRRALCRAGQHIGPPADTDHTKTNLVSHSNSPFEGSPRWPPGIHSAPALCGVRLRCR